MGVGRIDKVRVREDKGEEVGGIVGKVLGLEESESIDVGDIELEREDSTVWVNVGGIVEVGNGD